MSAPNTNTINTTLIDLGYGKWGNNPQVPDKSQLPSGPVPIDFRYEAQPKFGANAIENFDADLIKQKKGYRSGYRVTFPGELLPVNPHDISHFICAPVTQGENGEHYLSSLNSPIWHYGIGVIIARAGLAFEIWNGNGSAAIWSDTGYFNRSGIKRLNQDNDPNATIKNYTGPVIGYRDGYDGFVPTRGNITIACEITNVGVLSADNPMTWLSAFAWVSDQPDHYWLSWGKMHIPTNHIIPGLALRQTAAKTMAGNFEANIDIAYYTS